MIEIEDAWVPEREEVLKEDPLEHGLGREDSRLDVAIRRWGREGNASGADPAAECGGDASHEARICRGRARFVTGGRDPAMESPPG